MSERKKLWLLPIFLLMTLMINGCDGWLIFKSKADESPMDIKVGLLAKNSKPKNQWSGFTVEKELLILFAKDENLKIQWVTFNTNQELMDSLKKGEIDLGSGRFPQESAQDFQLLNSPAYEDTSLVLVCPRKSNYSSNSDEPSPRSILNLFGKESTVRTFDISKIQSVIVKSSSSATENISELKDLLAPETQISYSFDRSTFEILKAVNDGEFHCATLEQKEAQYFLRVFPRLEIAKEVSSLNLAFLVSPLKIGIENKFTHWFQAARRAQEISRIKERYFSYLNALDYHDRAILFKNFSEKSKSLLPLFKKFSREFNIPWPMIAAVAFQESHWDNEATSFTKVRGIMMLTEDTAKHLGVEDRKNLQQSLWGGAKYLKYLFNQTPKFLNPQERWILTLIGYNIGPGHLKDAQRLAVELGMNPYSWQDLKDVLPLLSDESYARYLEFGEARGQEPVDFVNRVLSYNEILSFIQR